MGGGLADKSAQLVTQFELEHQHGPGPREGDVEADLVFVDKTREERGHVKAG
ncbi:hypothetical protein D3C71_1230670 [compost metagenome]